MPPVPSASEIERAANLLRTGHLVAFPTETVYGLGAIVGLIIDRHDHADAGTIAATDGSRSPGLARRKMRQVIMHIRPLVIRATERR